jgi:hypothetical protein
MPAQQRLEESAGIDNPRASARVVQGLTHGSTSLIEQNADRRGSALQKSTSLGDALREHPPWKSS